MAESRLRINRYDPARDGQPAGGKRTDRYDEFTVQHGGNLTILEALFSIQENQDGALSFRYCCRAAVCGSCAMYINGRYRLACQTNVRHLPEALITVEPMPHMPLIKDLVCDMTGFFEKHEYIKPWLLRNSQDPEKEIAQSPKERRKLDMPIDCILCGCCYSSCPSVWGEQNYLGPAALLKAFRFEVDTRDEARKERLPLFDNERGVYRCHTITNCVEACPKELNPTEGIQWLKKSAVRRRLLGRWK
jgi:succinate dehydrogenase / fumarate reductase, iron-sulfur subunit